MADVNTGLQISVRGLRLIMRFEGFAANVYNDSAGYATIGFGHKLKPGEHFTIIDEASAQKLLHEDVAVAEKAIHSLVLVTLTQPQYDALVSFVYNIGISAFAASTLLRLLNAANYSAAAAELLHWNKIRENGTLVESAGLTARRAAEMVMFKEAVP